MTYKIQLNTNVSLVRVVLVALLMMCELILVKLIEILSQDRMPTLQEFTLTLCLGLLLLVTYIMTFLKKEED